MIDIADKMEKIADAAGYTDGTDTPLGEQCREAAKTIRDLRSQVERMKGALCMIVGLDGRHDLIDAQKFASSALSSTERT